MNFASVLVLAVIVVLLIIAIRNIMKNSGGCAGCSHKDGCCAGCKGCSRGLQEEQTKK
jgi:competence protein ComGC